MSDTIHIGCVQFSFAYYQLRIERIFKNYFRNNSGSNSFGSNFPGLFAQCESKCVNLSYYARGCEK